MLQGYSCIFLTDVFVRVVVAVAVDLAFFVVINLRLSAQLEGTSGFFISFRMSSSFFFSSSDYF